MRFFFFISLILITASLASCGLIKKEKLNYKIEKQETLDSIIVLESNIIHDTILDHDSDGVPDYIEIEASNIAMSTGPSREINSWIPTVENMDVVDRADEDLASSSGTIAYSVPNEMIVGEKYKITVRISKKKGTEIKKILVLGEREILISDDNIESTVIIENIRVERTMTVKLLSKNGTFEISPTSTDKQVLEDESYTEWSWIVRPLESGTNYLKMIITIKIGSEDEASYKDIVVFDKNIKVKSNVSLGFKSWFSEYWQWLMTTIIIPLVILFYKKRKKE